MRGVKIQPSRYYVVRKATEPRGPRSPGRRGAVVEGQPREGFATEMSALLWLTTMLFLALLRGGALDRDGFRVMSGEEIFASASR